MSCTFASVTIEPAPFGRVVCAIAHGETVVRRWNTDNVFGTLGTAMRRRSAAFPCVHKIVPVDPENSDTRGMFGPARWAIAPRKIDFARWASDYAAWSFAPLREAATEGGKRAVVVRRSSDCTSYVVEEFTLDDAGYRSQRCAVRMTQSAANAEFERVLHEAHAYDHITYVERKI